LAGISSLVMNVDRGQLFSQPMEPRARCSTHAHGVSMGQPFPKSSESNACPTIYVLFQESSDDLSSNAESVHWSWPWFLPELGPATQLFLATWCQSNSRPFFHGYHKQPKLPFLATLHFPHLTRLLNDPICHDLHCPPIMTNFPLDIPKFESKPNEYPGDHVTTFHLWCSSNSLKYDSV
jgi:hypothetical protein